MLNHLMNLISVPSFSNEEDRAADIWFEWLKTKGVKNLGRFHNNVYALNDNFDESKPILLLNSHLDTVKPVSSYTRDPFKAEIENGKLFGLGSNDAGASGVTLASTFLDLIDCQNLNFNLLLAITASEERMGEFGMRSFLPFLREKGLYPNMAIVGEPTDMEVAIGERGLVVLDCETYGKAGHAAREEGMNAIYLSMDDINTLRSFKFEKESEILGPVKISVTMISAGSQHNVVPDKCSYVADVRTTDAYSNEETVRILQDAVKYSKLTPRSTRIRASVVSSDSPLVLASDKLGLKKFVSYTTSDMALMYDIPSIKMGPGKSERSHTANEFVFLEEMRQALEIYKTYILQLNQIYKHATLE